MNRRFWARLVLVLLGMVVCIQAATAQDTGISEDQFWAQLNRTSGLLATVDAQTDPSDSLKQIQGLWEGVERVKLYNGNSVAIDLAWIRDALADGQPATLDALGRQVRALLDYHDSGFYGDGNFGGNPSLAALAEVLRDPRFQYADLTPTPVPEIPQAEPAKPAEASSLAQIALLVAGIAVVIAVFVYFARSLQVQQAAIETDENADPTTSTDAQSRADENAQSQDYRSAIRYMYLASLLMLDERGVIHYDSSLTNREHLRHLRDKPQVYDVLRRVINAFEEVWYGYLPVDETYYQRFRQQVDELHRIVA
ncbi:MAG: DUF4129 domain-containing protein [Chloroflexota bacterium]